MPKQEQSIAINNTDKDSVLSYCYSSFKQLNWQMLYANENTLMAETPKGWNNRSQQMIVTIEGNMLTVCSEMTGEELFDITNRNKKNIAAFIAAYELVKNNLPANEKEQNIAAINFLRDETARVAAKEAEDAAELDKAMNLSSSNLHATNTIIGINVVVFIMMVIDGAGIFIPNGLVHIKWGSDFGPLTLSGQWWRLFTSMFIHFGIIHLALNMYCLFRIGIYLEPMLGKPRFITAYLCTGIAAGIASLWWHTNPVNSAGASGAIFGMYGLFLALLTTNLIPGQARNNLLQSIALFIFINLVYGVKGGVDNAGHVGGLLSGVIVGYVYAAALKKEKEEQPSVSWIIPLLILVTGVFAVYFLQQFRQPAPEKIPVASTANPADFSGYSKFNSSSQDFFKLEERAMDVFNDTKITDAQRLTDLRTISLTEWDGAEDLAREMQTYNVSDQMKKKAADMVLYAQLRKQEIAIITEMDDNKTDTIKLHALRNQINAIIKDLKPVP